MAPDIDRGSSPEATVILTEAAAKRIREVMVETGPRSCAVRVGVVLGGFGDLEYVMGLEWASPMQEDAVSLQHGVTICVDPFSVVYLSGVTIDFVSTPGRAGFRFDNPRIPRASLNHRK